MANLVLEQSFEVPISPEEMNDSAKRFDQCLAAHGARWVRSYVSADRKRVICEFEAPDAEQVRESARSAGVPFDACWPAQIFSVDKPTESY